MKHITRTFFVEVMSLSEVRGHHRSMCDFFLMRTVSGTKGAVRAAEERWGMT